MKAFAPRAELTKQPLLEALARVLPARGLVLELASGTGQHVAHFASALPALQWQPSEIGPVSLASIDAWCAGLPNVRSALAIDAGGDWPVAQADAVIALDLVHLIDRAALSRLLRSAASVLAEPGVICLYGPIAKERTIAPRGLAGWTVQSDPPTLAELETAGREASLEIVDVQPLIDEACRLVVMRKSVILAP